jgi:hypothetical protein
MMPVFADTSYFIALTNVTDLAHDLADEYSRLVDQIVTTEWVLLEFADGLADSPRRQYLAAIRTMIFGTVGSVVVPLDMEIHRRAIELYVARPDKEWSLTACVSFVVMADRKLTDALSTDRHFEQAGFKALLKSN